MALKRTKTMMKSPVNEAWFAVAAFIGAGTSAPTVATDAQAGLRTRNNYASPQGGRSTVITRNGAGDYTFVFPEAPTQLLYVDAKVTGTAALQVEITTATVNADNTLTVRVVCATAAGVATDVTAAELLRVAVFGSDSNT